MPTRRNVPINFDTINQMMRYKLIYSMTGLVLGLVSMLGGIVLFLNGVTGSTSWTAKILGSESNLTDAAPGAILFIVGLFVVIATRYNPKIDYETGIGREKVKVNAKARPK